MPKRAKDARCTKWSKLFSDHNFDQSTSHQVKITDKIILYLSDKDGGDDQGGEEEQVVRVCRQLLIWCNLTIKGWKKRVWQSKDEEKKIVFLPQGIWWNLTIKGWNERERIFTARSVGILEYWYKILQLQMMEKDRGYFYRKGRWCSSRVRVDLTHSLDHTLNTRITHKQTSITLFRTHRQTLITHSEHKQTSNTL